MGRYPKRDRIVSMAAVTDLGSPGQLERKIPFGDIAFMVLAVVEEGTTTISKPSDSRHLNILYLMPKSNI